MALQLFSVLFVRSLLSGFIVFKRTCRSLSIFIDMYLNMEVNLKFLWQYLLILTSRVAVES